MMGSPSVQEDGELSNQGSNGSNEGDLSDLFNVDITPNVSYRSFVDVPLYDKKFSEVLQVLPEDEKRNQPKRPKPPQNTCWNCGGDHSLRDCQERKNYDNINRNRQLFRNSKPARASRYHLGEEQNYSNIQVGKISRRLRRALGLKKNQLPRHIYRMRCLGYPPGWVEEARVSHSGLSLFNSEGEEVADPGFEDGELVIAGAKDKFDIKKIIEYPGFNCPCDPDIIDETDMLNSKPMAEKDSIKFMQTMWQPKAVKAYKRRKMNSLDTSGTSKGSKDMSRLDDMELESEGEELGSEEGEVKEENPGDVQCELTPSQAKKRSGSVSPSPVDSKRLRTEEEPDNTTAHSPDAAEVKESSNDAANTDPQSTPTVSTPSRLGTVTSISLGTPVIVTSPYTSLPSAEKFAVNICDVINFENLPDSTGKYEQMSGLIKKVRTFVSKLNSEEDED